MANKNPVFQREAELLDNNTFYQLAHHKGGQL
jgi:hypothetical protein